MSQSFTHNQDWQVPDGWQCHVYETLGSSNDTAMALAKDGHAGNVWIVAKQQSSGRGRMGRVWHSPLGNLYASCMLKNPCNAEFLPQLGFVAGVALMAALQDFAMQLTGKAFAGHLKWPNDVVAAHMINNQAMRAKLSGMLLETMWIQNAQVKNQLAVVIGFGVNCVSSPQNLAYPTVALGDVLGCEVPVEAVFTALAKELPEKLALWQRGQNFAAIRALWLAASLPLGSALTIKHNGRTISGTFAGLDTHGHLLLQTAEGLLTHVAGDVIMAAH